MTPALIPAWVNREWFEEDLAAHKVMNPLITTQQQILDLMTDTNLLLGYDLDTAAIAFYNNVKLAAKNNVPGARTAYENLRKQFPGRRTAKPEEKKP